MNLRKLRVVAGIAAVAAVFAMAAPASSLPRYTENFDCDSFEYGDRNPEHAIATGETLTIAITSCGGMPVDIYSGTVILNGIDVTADGYFEVPGDTSRITVTAGTELSVPGYVEFYFPEAPLAEDPKGALLDTETVTFGRNLPEFTAGTPRQIADNLSTNLTRQSDCDLMAGDHVYVTSTLTVTKKGTYTARVVETDPAREGLTFYTDQAHPFRDMFSVVYPGYERPWNAASKSIVGCDDDASSMYTIGNEFTTSTGYVASGRNPWMTMKLKPGKYTIVWSTFETINSFDWSRGDNDGYPFNSHKSSFTYEVWGPTGALVG